MSESKSILPNSLLKSGKVDNSMSKNGNEWLFLFCASCGADGGRVLKTDVPNREEFAFYLCDPCATKYGEIAGTMYVPDEVFWKKVHEASIERYGEVLDANQMLIVLDDPENFLHKLAKDRNTFLASE